MPEPFRIAPKLAVQEMQTFAAIVPKETHTKRVTCVQAECAANAYGWATTVDTSTDLGARQASYIRLKSGRHFTVSAAGAMVTFEFPAGQDCFSEHRQALEREPIFLKVGGDWRGRTSEPLLYRATDWVDTFATHQQSIADAIQRG